MIQSRVSFSLVGKVLAGHVLRENGTILLNKGTILTDHFIRRLKDLKIDYVYIAEQEQTDSKTYNQVKTSYGIKHYRTSVYREMTRFADSQELVNWFCHSSKQGEYHSTIRSIFHSLALNEDVNDFLVKMMQTDRQLFDKALNVALISGIIGFEKRYTSRELEELCIGALLCDIGMTEIPKEIRTKNCILTKEEKEQINSHTTIGYELLKHKRRIPYRSALCVLQHHERYDGSGYPNQLLHDQIDEYAQIVSLADVFYSLISPRYHRDAFTKNEAVEFLFAAGNHYFDIELVKIFFRSVSIYPIASEVTLSNGYVGIVTQIHKDLLHKPVVRVFEKNGNRIIPPYDIDLRKHKNVYIVS